MFNRSRSFLIPLFCAFALLAASIPAQAQGLMRIAAVVNDDIISALDLAQRVRLTMATSRMPNTPEVQKQLASNLLRAMIDERLKKQEAERLKIEVSDERIEAALQNYARAQRIKQGLLDEFLASLGMDREILKEQAYAELGWNEVLKQTGGARLRVNDADVDKALAEKNANKGKPEYAYSEIYLPFNGNSELDASKQMANSLIEHIKNGSPFSSLARDFSQSPSAPDGGALGWVQSGHIDPNIENVLIQLKEGEHSQPIQTPSGFFIVQLHEKRLAGQEDIKELLDVAQIILPVAPDAPAELWATTNAKAIELAHQIKSCEHTVELGKEVEGAKAGVLKGLNLSDMPTEIRNTLADMGKNQITTMEQKDGAVLVLMVCNRVTTPAKPEITVRKEIQNTLFAEKMARESRRLLQQLRRTAFVDIRL